MGRWFFGRGLWGIVYLYLMQEAMQYISIDADVRFGKPCIKGTRITVAEVLGWLASGMTEEEIIEDFPLIKPAHIKASLLFAAYREQIIKIIAA